jgi:hypothetical protein
MRDSHPQVRQTTTNEEITRRIDRLEQAVAMLGLEDGDVVDGVIVFMCGGCRERTGDCRCAVGEIIDEVAERGSLPDLGNVTPE